MHKNYKYILGLDIGITSVGWGIIDKDTFAIIDKGVRLFEESDASNNLKRRTMRSGRRLKRRRTQRIIDMLKLLQREKIIVTNNLPALNPYEVRVKGLTEKLTNQELAVALINIAKKRGSSLEVALDDEAKDEKAMQEGLAKNEMQLSNSNKFVCELQLEKLRSGQKLRDHYNIYKLDSYIKEVEEILKNQNLSAEVNKNIIEIIKRKRHFSIGPGSEKSPTKYGSYRLERGKVVQFNLIDFMRGKCSVYSSELRAPQKAYSADLYNLLNDLNNLTIKNRENQKITEAEKRTIISDYINKKGGITVNELHKFLNCKEANEEITGFRLKPDGKTKLLTEFEGYKKFLKILVQDKLLENKQKLDEIINILTKTKVIDERKSDIKKLIVDIDNNTLDKLANMTGISGYHSLSLKAIYEFNDEMLVTNLNQMQIATNIEANNKNTALYKGKQNITFEADNFILSAVARRAQKQTFKVINDLRKEYGEFDHIVIEMAREKNSDEQRKNIQRRQKNNEKNNTEISELLKDELSVSNMTKLKVRLYKEQDGKCMYSGTDIDFKRLIADQHAYEIDHIIPYSISFDDSLKNKVLVLAGENQKKENLTPFGYFTSGKIHGKVKNFDEFKQLVLSNQKIKYKWKNLLDERNITKFDVMKEFVNRNLVDTRYATRVVLNTISDYCKANDIKTVVSTVKGLVTDTFRKRHGKKLLVKNRDKYMHHAIDALIVARLAKQKAISYIMSHKNEFSYDKETGEIIDNPLEDSGIEKYIYELTKINSSDVKFSWKVDKKTNRQFSDETIYSTRQYEEGECVIKKYKNIYGADGEKVAELFRNKKKDSTKLLVYRHDKKTYEHLAKIVESYPSEKNPFSAYKNDHGNIRKYAKSGKGVPIINLKYIDGKLGSHLDISKKYIEGSNRVILLQISSYRADIYKSNEGEYKFVTVRRYHLKPIDENKFIIDSEVYEEEKRKKGIDNKYEFQFSLNRNEIIEITKEEKNDVKETVNVKERYRFIAVADDRAKKIEVKLIDERGDKQQIILTVGNRIKQIAKYAVNSIGKTSRVEKEELALVAPLHQYAK